MQSIFDRLVPVKRFLIRHSLSVATIASFIAALALISLWHPVPTNRVVTVIEPLPAGSILRSEQLQTVALSGSIPTDVVADTALATGQRLRVEAIPGTPLRTAYFAPANGRSTEDQTMLLEVEPALARILARGDLIDIYQNCTHFEVKEDLAGPCKAQVLATAVEVVEVQNESSSQWASPQSASLTIKASPNQIKVLAGVSEPRALTIAITQRSE